MNLKENLDKLPKWAQYEVGLLQRRLDEATKEVNRLKENPASNTIVGFESNLDSLPPPQYLKDNQLITFKLEKGEVSARIERNAVTIMGHGEGDFIVKPSVSNAIKIYLL